MQTWRVWAVLSAALCVGGLSVGAYLGEDRTGLAVTSPAAAGAGHQAQASADPAAARAEVQGREAALRWLALVDAGQYGESWDAAAQPFRAALTRADWERQVGQARAPLGTLGERRPRSARFSTRLPGALDGAYVVCEFAARFERKRAAVETITVLRESDGTWRAAGYFIR